MTWGSAIPHCSTCNCPDPFPIAENRCEATTSVGGIAEEWGFRCRLPIGHDGGHRSDIDYVCWEDTP